MSVVAPVFLRRPSRLLSIAAVAIAAVGCRYNPARFAGTPSLSECMGVPATIGVGWAEAEGVDGDGDGYPGTAYFGTEGDDVVVITNGPVVFHGLGGDDLICVNDTGLTWGPGDGYSIRIDAGAGDDTVYDLTHVTDAGIISVDLGSGVNAFYGGPASDEVWLGGDDHVETGTGNDLVVDGIGSGEIDLGAGDDFFLADAADAAAVDVVRGGPGTDYYLFGETCGGDIAGAPDAIDGFEYVGGFCWGGR